MQLFSLRAILCCSEAAHLQDTKFLKNGYFFKRWSFLWRSIADCYYSNFLLVRVSKNLKKSQ
ncbi:MAG: hypothetical protein D6680_13110 [Cyanobacteria bacterium J007]|nr:MAG: hypothetical protein D6680_13110 [Cyanobacteria bacterium J007]